MGFFSFNTADSKESIPNASSGLMTKPVFLIQPNGKNPIREDYYIGYGCFGGVDAFDWLAENNLPKECIKKWKGELRNLGCELYYDNSDLLVDQEGYSYACGNEALHLARHLYKVEAKEFSDYGSMIKVGCIESSVDEHIKSGRLRCRNFKDFIINPLKFSFNENARYNDLGRSTNCVFQGYFYPTE